MNEQGVLHVITSLHTGGAEGMLERLVLAPRARPFEQRVVSLTPGGAVRERLERHGMPVSDLGMRRSLPDPRAVVRLARLIRAHRPRVLQSWMYHADALSLTALWLSGLRRSVRLYWGVRCSNMDPRAYGAQLRPLIAVCARLARRTDGVVANSLAGREHHRRLGYRPPAFPVIFNGIDTRRFRPSPERRRAVRAALGIEDGAVVLAAVARVDVMKGYDVLTAAVASVPDIVLMCIGAGTETLHDGARVFGLGRRDDVPDLLAAADVLVCSSRFGEGFSNALAEGMACGLPAVVTDVGDARHIVGNAGHVVAPDDVAALRGAIVAVTSMPAAERAAWGTAARDRIVDHFSMALAVSRFDDLHACGPAALQDPDRA